MKIITVVYEDEKGEVHVEHEHVEEGNVEDVIESYEKSGYRVIRWTWY